MNFVITFGTSITVPANPAIAEHFNVSEVKAVLPLTLYTLGIAFGPILLAPLSETFGRLWLYRISFTMLLAFLAGAGAAQSFATLLVCRFLASFLGSPALAMGAGTIADLWHLGRAGGLAGSMFILGPFLGPTMAPLAGAYIMSDRNGDWRWTQWLICLVGAPIWASTWIMQETYTSKRRAPPGTPLSERLRTLGGTLQVAVTKPAKMLVVEIPVLSLTLYTSYTYALVFSYFASCSYVLPLYYEFDKKELGLSFLSVIIGYFLAALVYGICDAKLYRKALALSGGELAAPEHRLYAAMIGSIFLPAALFWYAWEPHRGGHWAALVAAGIPFGLGAFTLFLSTITFLVDMYQSGAAASALAANGVLRYILGAVFPLFTQQMYRNLGPHWAGSVFAFLSLPMIPIPFLLYRYGHVLRRRSHFPTSHAGRARLPIGKHAMSQTSNEVEISSGEDESKKEAEA